MTVSKKKTQLNRKIVKGYKEANQKANKGIKRYFL